MSIVVTVAKDTAEVTRLLADMSGWLDDGEVIGSLTRFSLMVNELVPLATAWQVDYPFDPTTVESPIVDTSPLIMTGASILGGTQASILVGSGTPGVSYIVSCIATGSSSGRQKELDFYVNINEMVNENMISSLDPTPSETTTVVGGTVALSAGTTGTVFVDNAAGAAITITLPPTPILNQTVDGVDSAGNAATYTIHWVGDSGSLITGVATYDFTLDFQSASFRWSGTEWAVV
jgi:hypothetical protein